MDLFLSKVLGIILMLLSTTYPIINDMWHVYSTRVKGSTGWIMYRSNVQIEGKTCSLFCYSQKVYVFISMYEST